MNNFSIIEHGPFLTSFVAQNSYDALYSVESRRLREGWWSTSIRRTDPVKGTSIELANVTYIDWSTTFVAFGAREVELGDFLQRSSTTSNSRIFVAPGGETYKWRINGKNLELYHRSSGILLAQSSSSRIRLFSKRRHPTSLQLSGKTFDQQTMDAIIVTFAIMEHLLQDRLKYKYPGHQVV